MNIALYIRLSKEDNLSSESKSITSQRMYLRNYIDKFDYKNVYEYVDDGFSGTNFNRPAFAKMIKDIENKKIDTIITKDSSRLGRNISWVTFYIEEYFPSKKVRYISIDDNYDSSEVNSSESEMLTFKSLFNDYYCKDISKKIKSSLRIKKIEGKFTGWKAPYGYQRKKEDYHKLEIDKNVCEVVKTIFDLANDDNTPSGIAKILNDNLVQSPSTYAKIKNSNWSTKTVKDILENQVYIGNMTQGKRKKINYKIKKSISVPKNEWIIKENTHEAIIDKKIFDSVQNKLHKYHNIKENKSSKNELINLIYCKECNSKIGLNNKKNKSYCVCNNYKKRFKEKVCTPHTVNYDKLKDIIILELQKEIINVLEKRKMIDIKDLIIKKSYLENKIEVLSNNFLDNYIKNQNKKYISIKEKEIFDLNKELTMIIDKIKRYICIQKKEKELIKNKELYIEMIDKIYLSEKGEIEIIFSYSNH